MRPLSGLDGLLNTLTPLWTDLLLGSEERASRIIDAYIMAANSP
jgi:hypothetical protein